RPHTRSTRDWSSDVCSSDLQDGTAFQVVLNRQRAQALLDDAGRSDLQLPGAIDGATISVDVPKGVTAAYGGCPLPAGDAQRPDRSEEGRVGKGGRECGVRWQ